ncbi:hypothetical protein KKH13_03445 [Patescibacteria group bacterium]|nr:hypothetical protein [Patescibacteria group bacterium]
MPGKEGDIFETLNGAITGAENPHTNFRLSHMLQGEMDSGTWVFQPTLVEAIDGYLQKSVGRSIPEFLRQGLGLDRLQWQFVEAKGLLDLAFLGFDKDIKVESDTDWKEAQATIQVNRRDMGIDKTVFRETLGIAGVNGDKRLVVAGYNLEPPYLPKHDFQLKSLDVSLQENEVSTDVTSGREDDIWQAWYAFRYGSVVLQEYFQGKLYHLFPSLITPVMQQQADNTVRLMRLERGGNGAMVFFEQNSPKEELKQANFYPSQFQVIEDRSVVSVVGRANKSELGVLVPRYLQKVTER